MQWYYKNMENKIIKIERRWNIDHYDEVAIKTDKNGNEVVIVTWCECQLTNGALVPEAQVEKETLAKFTIGETK